MFTSHDVGAAGGIPLAPREADSDSGGDADRTGHGGKGRGELFAVALANVEEEALHAVDVVIEGDLDVVREVVGVDEEVLELHDSLVICRSTRRDRLGSTGDVRIPAGIDGGLTVEAFLRKLRVLRDEVGAETIGRSGRQRRRVVVGHLRLDDVGEACSGSLLGFAFHYQRAGLDLVLQFDVARGQDVRDLVGGRQIDAAESRCRDLLPDGRAVDGGGDVGRHSTVGVVEAARAPPLPAVELGERHLAPVVTVDGVVDAHREQFTLGLVEEAGTDLNERTRDPTGLRSVVPLGRIEELLARIGHCRPGHHADREGQARRHHARPHRGRESSRGAGGDPHVVAGLTREAQA